MSLREAPTVLRVTALTSLDKYIRTFRLALPTCQFSSLSTPQFSLNLHYSKNFAFLWLSEFVKIPTSEPSKTGFPPPEMFLSLLSRSLTPIVLKESTWGINLLSRINFPKRKLPQPSHYTLLQGTLTLSSKVHHNLLFHIHVWIFNNYMPV